MNWKIWDKMPDYGNTLFKRATGDLEEMQSSISLCNHVAEIYRKGMRLLDVGCGAGHYLRSLRNRIDQHVDYTGVDATSQYVELAKRAFNDVNFLIGDIQGLPLNNNQFDIVMANNVLLHLPPPPTKALSELIRVSRKYVIVRTVCGERSYIIKEVRTQGEKCAKAGSQHQTGDEFDLFDSEGNPKSFNFFNMYTEQYLRTALHSISDELKVNIIKDSSGYFDNRKVGGDTATYVSDGKQISGNLILDWRFILIEKHFKSDLM